MLYEGANAYYEVAQRVLVLSVWCGHCWAEFRLLQVGFLFFWPNWDELPVIGISPRCLGDFQHLLQSHACAVLHCQPYKRCVQHRECWKPALKQNNLHGHVPWMLLRAIFSLWEHSWRCCPLTSVSTTSLEQGAAPYVAFRESVSWLNF